MRIEPQNFRSMMRVMSVCETEHEDAEPLSMCEPQRGAWAIPPSHGARDLRCPGEQEAASSTRADSSTSIPGKGLLVFLCFSRHRIAPPLFGARSDLAERRVLGPAEASGWPTTACLCLPEGR